MFISEYMKFYHYSAYNVIQVLEMAQETDLELAQDTNQMMNLEKVI